MISCNSKRKKYVCILEGNWKKGAVKYCHLKGTTVVSVFLLTVTQCVDLCQLIGIQRQLLSLSNVNILVLSFFSTNRNAKLALGMQGHGENSSMFPQK